MDSRWNDDEAARFAHDPLSLRAYGSRLLGQDPELVLHGGGNTSVKTRETDFTGDDIEVLWVKGSGWDLKTIEPAGFAPVRMRTLLAMGARDTLSDTMMVKEQRAAMLDPDAPTPSIEAVLHALIPLPWVDHTHADAVVAVSNAPLGEQRLRSIYGERVLIVPYVMPGFELAKAVQALFREHDAQAYEGMILAQHGVFSWGATARESYERMIRLVDDAERYLKRHQAWDVLAVAEPAAPTALELGALRQAVARVSGRALVARTDQGREAVGFSMLPGIGDLATRGPLTPDHVIRTKRVPLVIAGGQDFAPQVDAFVRTYRDYFERHRGAGDVMLDPSPRWAVWPGHGLVAFGKTARDADVVLDIARHTARAIQRAEAVGGWSALSEAELYRMEYWELEQKKLRQPNKGPAPSFAGQVALVTGAAHGIGRAVAQRLSQDGAMVVGLDRDPIVLESGGGGAYRGIVCDVTDSASVGVAVEQAVLAFGGIDLVVSNAGSFPDSAALEDLSDAMWREVLALNLDGHMKVLRASVPHLAQGFDPAVVIVASKNVAAPGPGVAAYSVAKAGLTQLARVAALELGARGVRVNVVHPDAVFDTHLWTPEKIALRAERYALSVEQYKTRNVLGREVRARDVAAVVARLLSSEFALTTGAQVPIDGGNDRVI